MSLAVNRAKVSTAATGTGSPITLSSAVATFQTLTAAGCVTGLKYNYLIEDGSAWEIGWGVYNSATPSMTRNLVASSTGSLLNLSGSATLAISTPAGEVPQVFEIVDLGALGAGTYTFGAGGTIPQTHSSLRLDVVARGNSATRRDIQLRVNGLSTAIYDIQRLYLQNTSGGPGGQTIGATAVTTTAAMAASTDAAGMMGQASFELLNYSGSVGWKNFIQLPSRQPNHASSGNAYALTGTGQVRTTSPITSLELFIATDNFDTGSWAKLTLLP